MGNRAWLALMIGNSRLHWALFHGGDFVAAWDTPHLAADQVQRLIDQQFIPSAWSGVPPAITDALRVTGSTLSSDSPISLWLASVVPSQTELWQDYPKRHLIQSLDLPIAGLYPTIGSDRVLALWGAGQTWSWPVLVIDGGTALTLTAATPERGLLGGAILPGLGLQFQMLAQQTAALPPVTQPHELPRRWATCTPEAIRSGILYTMLAGLRDYLEDWWQRYPNGTVVLTGGDGERLQTYLQAQFSAARGALRDQTAHGLIYDPYLIFWGIRAYKDSIQS